MASEWLSPERVCDYVPGLTIRKLQRMRDEGKGPRYAKPTGKTVVYSRADVDAWLRSKSIETRES